MKKLVLALALIAALPALAAAESHKEMPAGVTGEMMMWIKDAESKLVELAEATPDAKYAFRPSKDVRTTGEVFMHVATANYGVASFCGVAPPGGFDFMKFEKSATKRSDVVKHLKESFDHMEKGLAGMSAADLEAPVEFFGMKTTKRGAYMLLMSHAHEHLGQSIAYARSNGVVPPWTAREQAAMKEKAKETEKAKTADAK